MEPGQISSVLAAFALVLALVALVLAAVAYRRAGRAGITASQTAGTRDRRAQAGGEPTATEAEQFLAAFQAAKSETPGAVLVIDGDQFSELSGQLDEMAIEEALGLIERAIRAAIRPYDLVGRIEGHRFAVFLRGADPALSRSIAERICETVEDTIFMSGDGRISHLSVSVGGVSTREGAELDEIGRATEKLEKGRAAGGGRIAVSD